MSRTYRADAIILVLGITIFRRAGVGGGQASLEETGEGASLRRTLFFAAGSDPKHAHGLNRLGWIREVVLGPASTPSESTYFGVLTSSPEESLEHARKAVDDPAIRPRRLQRGEWPQYRRPQPQRGHPFRICRRRQLV